MAVLAVLLFAVSAQAGASLVQDLEIGRMRVALWPEYDSSGVLFIYDGRFRDNEAFPNETSFLLPGGAVISDACSLSPKGTHFCQLYTQKNAGDVDEVSLKLPYPNFYLSFHTDPFTNGAPDGKRVLKHLIKTNHRVDRLEVDIQSPLRAEGFTVVSPAGFVRSERKGYTHFEKVYENVARGETIEIDIEYLKSDRRPSVDIKYSPMSQMGGSETPYQRQRGFVTYIYVAAGAGLVVLAGLIFAVLRSRGR